MAIPLFSRVALSVDIPEHGLKAGDVATVTDFHEARGRKGYSLEVFGATGETLAVVVVEESQVAPLRKNEVLHVRHIDTLAA